MLCPVFPISCGPTFKSQESSAPAAVFSFSATRRAAPPVQSPSAPSGMTHSHHSRTPGGPVERANARQNRAGGALQASIVNTVESHISLVCGFAEVSVSLLMVPCFLQHVGLQVLKVLISPNLRARRQTPRPSVKRIRTKIPASFRIL